MSDSNDFKQAIDHIDLSEQHKEYNVTHALRDVIRATEDGQVYVALAFLNGMLAAMTMEGEK